LERGLTQDAVALVLGVSRTYIVDLEAGRRLESWPAWLAMMVAMGYDPRIVAPELVTLLDNVSAPVTGDDLNTAETPQTVDAQRPKRGKHK
jgi:DNA-binding XRE family transcriptional regulator